VPDGPAARRSIRRFPRPAPTAPAPRVQRLMKPKHLYLALCVVGTVLPYSRFLPFVRDHGLDPRAFWEQLFSTPVGGFFGMDVLVSSVVLWVLVAVEGRRARVRHLWAPVAANVAVGVSLGLPLFLYLRELRLEDPA
jgi:Terpene cyclase DEP1